MVLSTDHCCKEVCYDNTIPVSHMRVPRGNFDVWECIFAYQLNYFSAEGCSQEMGSS